MANGEELETDLDLTDNIVTGSISGPGIDVQVNEFDLSSEALDNLSLDMKKEQPARPRLFARPPLLPRLRGIPFPRFPLISKIIVAILKGGGGD